jgi:hypothetical protein
VAIWGHPEDVLAVAFAVFALANVLEGHDTAAGWLLGGAIATQLFSVLAIPALLAVLGLRRGALLLARAAILPGFLFIAVAVPDFHDSVWTLFHQPAVPGVNHVTPWVQLSPRLARNVVAGGPARLLGLVCALLAGVAARGQRHRPATVIWLMAIALGARCVFDPVMVPYYVMPVVALALIAAVGNDSVRYLLTIAAGAGLTVMTFTHHDMWTYWTMMTAIMFLMLGLAWPTRGRRTEAGQAGGVRWMPSDTEARVPVGVH